MRRDRWYLGLILAAIFGGLAIHADQPIVENYVGRQIPTAMVARNLERGSGFLHPTLDTAPFPNRFLVEPPIYAQLVAWVRSIGFAWEKSGRLTSAVLTTLGAWSFFGLVRRREGSLVALVALGSFGIFPVTLRYGRAFQPDPAMLGFVLLGLRGWDEYQVGGKRRWAWLGGFALMVGLTLKITSAWVLIPYFLVVPRLPVKLRLALCVVMMLPALAWYFHAWSELRLGSLETRGSLASAANAAIWMRALSPEGWLRFSSWEAIARNLVFRCFTPVGFVLGLLGWTIIRPGGPDRFWAGWGIGCGLAILGLASKWHHGYYWMVVAPPAALGVARSLVFVGSRGSRGFVVALGLGLVLLVTCGYQSRATWRTPREWRAIRELTARIAAVVPPDSLLVAPEAVLFYADRPGFRLEFSPEAALRASGEWDQSLSLDQDASNPMALVDFYQSQQAAGDPEARFDRVPEHQNRGFSARFVADVGPVDVGDRRALWRDALRHRRSTRIHVDTPDLIIAEFGYIDENG